jgi:hypothetical protein
MRAQILLRSGATWHSRGVRSVEPCINGTDLLFDKANNLGVIFPLNQVSIVTLELEEEEAAMDENAPNLIEAQNAVRQSFRERATEAETIYREMLIARAASQPHPFTPGGPHGTCKHCGAAPKATCHTQSHQ